MRIPKMSIAIALVSCGLSLAVLHHLRAREEGKYWWFRAQNDSMRYQAYLRHRSLTSAAKTELPPAPAQATAAAEGRLPSIQSHDTATALQYGYHNAGLRSPGDSLQTFVWACDRSDAQRVASMITMEEAERRKAEAFLASLPPEARTKAGSLEALAANLLILSSLGRSFPSSEVLAAAPIELQGEERATCGTVQPMSFRKVGGDWKYELSAERLERLYREITQAMNTVQSLPRS